MFSYIRHCNQCVLKKLGNACMRRAKCRDISRNTSGVIILSFDYSSLIKKSYSYMNSHGDWRIYIRKSVTLTTTINTTITTITNTTTINTITINTTITTITNTTTAIAASASKIKGYYYYGHYMNRSMYVCLLTSNSHVWSNIPMIESTMHLFILFISARGQPTSYI